jgi:CO/xanthine dehydrogenase Mo-binding subunit
MSAAGSTRQNRCRRDVSGRTGQPGRERGQPCAAVVTESRFAGKEAAERVVADYEPPPVVVDPEDAAPDEVLLPPDGGTNTATGRSLIPNLRPTCSRAATWW